MRFVGIGGDVNWDEFMWGQLRELAQRHGWEPMGTVLGDKPYSDQIDNANRRGVVWDGRYDIIGFQTVTTEDARGLADALERALPLIPDNDWSEDAPDSFFDDASACLFAGETKAAVREFIALCRSGPFEIR